MRRLTLGVMALLCIAATVARGGEKQPPAFDPDLPPCVVKTEPANRAKDVDFTLREIKVTYDRPMTTGANYSWIIHQRLGVYPGTRGGPEPRWENEGRTCVLPVRLSPDTLYAIGVNSFRHTGFRDPKGKIAVPHVWVFRTRKAKKPPEF